MGNLTLTLPLVLIVLYGVLNARTEYDDEPIEYQRFQCERCGLDFTRTEQLFETDPEHDLCADCADHDVLCGCSDHDCTATAF